MGDEQQLRERGALQIFARVRSVHQSDTRHAIVADEVALNAELPRRFLFVADQLNTVFAVTQDRVVADDDVQHRVRV